MPRSFRRMKPAQLASWEQMLNRLFTSQTGAHATRQVKPRQLTASSLPGARRIGAAPRPGFATSRTIFRAQQQRGFRFSPWRRNKGNGQGAEENLSLTARLRKLSREYGRAAIVVYFLLSVLDYPFFFMLVKAVGTERIGKVEHLIVSTVASVVPESIRLRARGLWESLKEKYTEFTGDGKTTDKIEAVGRWGVEEAQERHDEEASLATQLALAYAIHKTFIFVRVPLTIAVTPRIVKQLRAWGWNIGKKIRRQ